MNRAYLLIACCCLPLAAGPAPARDLWGLDGVILTDAQTPVLTRTERRSLRGSTSSSQDTFAYGPPAPSLPVPMPVPGGQIITAPPIPGLGSEPDVATEEPAYIEPAMEPDAELSYGPPAAEPSAEPSLRNLGNDVERSELTFDPQAEDSFDAPEREVTVVSEPEAEPEVETATAEPFHLPASVYEGEGPDISGVEIFVPDDLVQESEATVSEEPVTAPEPAPAEEDAPTSDEFDLASATEPRITIPPVARVEEPEEPRRPPQQFGSGAYTGYFTGVGIAEGMQLQLYLSGEALSGSFVDRRGQNFRIDGQLAEEEGKAQAMVISVDVPIGYMNLQLTNLGLTSLFVPLDQNLAPQTASARQYEFLRTLSPAAQSRLEAERAAREATLGNRDAQSRNEPDFPESEEEGLREVFPGDQDGDE